LNGHFLKQQTDGPTILMSWMMIQWYVYFLHFFYMPTVKNSLIIYIFIINIMSS